MSSKRWNSQEKLKLMKLFSEGKDYDIIGEKLNRSSNAIKLRLGSIIYDNIIKGKNVSVLSRMLNTDRDKIIQIYYAHKSFKQGRGETVIDVDLNKDIDNKVNGIFSRNSSFQNNKSRDNNPVGGGIINNDQNVQKIDDSKLKKIEDENQMLEAIIKNYRMKRYLRKLYIDGKLDKKSMNIYNKYIKDFNKN